MAATLSDLEIETMDEILTFEDATTPAGHFGAMAVITDTTIIYLLEGAKGSPDAVIKGRIEMNGDGGTTWVGGGVLQGTYTGGVSSFTESFASMV